jgi:transcriptional regulator with XRE-family HTH domain
MLEEDLLTGEKLYLLRMRRRATIKKMAADYGVSKETYLDWEAGKQEFPHRIALYGLYPREFYTVLRLRSGLRRGKVARAAGLSCKAVEHIERGVITHRRVREVWGV